MSVRRALVLLVTVLNLVSGCATEPEATTTPTTATTMATTTTIPTTTATAPTDENPDPVGAAVITVNIYGDVMSVDPADPEVAAGDIVELTVVSDIEDVVHVHGYDRLLPVGPEGPASLRFIADVVGMFEVELEQAGKALFQLTVN